MNNTHKRKLIIMSSFAVIMSISTAAFAEVGGTITRMSPMQMETMKDNQVSDDQRGVMMKRTVSIVGTVANISGSMITITPLHKDIKAEKVKPAQAPTATPANTPIKKGLIAKDIKTVVDATHATVKKSETVLGTLADIKVGDKIYVVGVVQMTNNTPTIIAESIYFDAPSINLEKNNRVESADTDTHANDDLSGQQNQKNNFFGRIEGFFRGLFGVKSNK